MCFVKEPKRIGMLGVVNDNDKASVVPLSQVIEYFKLNWKSYSTIYLGFTMTVYHLNILFQIKKHY